MSYVDLSLLLLLFIPWTGGHLWVIKHQLWGFEMFSSIKKKSLLITHFVTVNLRTKKRSQFSSVY